MKRLLLFVSLLLSFCTKAQIMEKFSEPLLTSSYPWEGNTDKFRIKNNELQLFARESTSDALLYLETTTLYNNEWECRVKSDRTSSSSNYCSVYLFSKNNDQIYPGYALLVRIGHSSKKISLCQQYNDRPPVPLIEGMSIGEGGFEVDIKVTSDSNGLIALYCKEASASEYSSFGSIQLSEPDGKGYFMLYTKYTANYSRNKYFDNIFVKQYQTDANSTPDEEKKESIKIDRIEEVTANSMRIYFNKPADENSSYFIFSLSEIDEEIEVYISNENELVYQLEWNEALERGKQYTLVWGGIFDSDKNECKGSYSFISTEGKGMEGSKGNGESIQYAKGAIIINEVMANPNGLNLIPQTEYVELFNTTSSPIDLNNWVFFYDNKETPLAAMTLPGKGYVVLFREGRDIFADKKGLTMPLSTFPAQLANDGKGVGLISPSGDIIDQSYYPKAKAGISWERQGEKWVLSADSRGGTPGSVNNLHIEEATTPSDERIINPGEIIFNEILPDPFINGSEYLELYNRTGEELPVSSLSIATRKTDGSLSTKYPLGSLLRNLQPKDYLVLTRNKAGVISFYMTDDEKIQEVKIPVLANTSSTIVLLRTSDEKIIDEVSYSSKWHLPSVKNQKGVALERIDPDVSSKEPKNWISAASVAGFGTPGYQNSQYMTEESENVSHIEEPSYSKDKGEYYIAYHLNQPGYSCRAWVYSLSGIQMAKISDNELIGTNGVITWNGVSINGSRLRQGLYILYVELYHPSGKVVQLKKPILIYGD